MDHTDQEAEIIWLRLQLGRRQQEAEEHRARRLALEEELAEMQDTWLHRPVEVRYINVPVYRSPMPAAIVRGRVRYVDRFVTVPPSFGTPDFFGQTG